MFDFSFGELVLVGVVALVVLGPERLPAVARTAGVWLGKVRRFASEVKTEFDRQVEAAELKDVKAQLDSAVKDVQGGLDGARDALSDEIPAWERLPPQRTPADFGLDEEGRPLPDARPWAETGGGLHIMTIRRQAMNRRREGRPRVRPRPQLRVRRHAARCNIQ
ncbi:MAG: Sec-independent protein translocase protein TatB [Neisseria sp.]|nr:Sec-independent protein translocase protein TatB [Neisseria sp.]